MQYDPKKVGEVIRKLRIQRGMTQEVFSGFAAIGRTHLSMIESGAKQPNLKTLWQIAAALNMKPSQLIAEIESTHT